MAIFASSRPFSSYIAPIFLAIAILFGGASRIEVPGWIIVTAVALACIVWLVWVTPAGGLAINRTAAALMAGCVAIPLIQLIPLPYGIWSNLPGRTLEVEAFRAAGLDGWLPISTMPGRTLLACLGLIAPICAFVIAAQLGNRGRRRLAVAIVALACASAILGLLQVAGGEGAGLRFFRITANDAGVGFFANPNHQATLLMCAVPFAIVSFVERLPERGPVPPTMIAMLVAIVIGLAVGTLLTWSRAGLVFLVIVVIGGAFLLPDLLPQGKRKVLTQRRLLMVAGLLGAGLVGLGMVVLGTDGGNEVVRHQGGARLENIPTFIRIAADYLPLGSGLGSFDPVYRTYETLAMINPVYLNQAHNEPAQILIEAGVPGALLMIAFLVWWARLAFAAWSARGDGEALLMRRAASLGSLLYLLHSLVDYPLRTPSGAVVFAMLCALMLPVRGRENPSK